MNVNTAANMGGDPYKDNNPHADNNAHRAHDPYATKRDPYKNEDAYSPRERRERKRPWALDFELLRFFRQKYNDNIDFEESPRAFFDEEELLKFRIDILKRNFSTIIFKFLFMAVFTFV